MEFICDESCGKCTPCRIGTKRMLEILTKITDGKATMKDLEELENNQYKIKLYTRTFVEGGQKETIDYFSIDFFFAIFP